MTNININYLKESQDPSCPALVLYEQSPPVTTGNVLLYQEPNSSTIIADTGLPTEDNFNRLLARTTAAIDAYVSYEASQERIKPGDQVTIDVCVAEEPNRQSWNGLVTALQEHYSNNNQS